MNTKTATQSGDLALTKLKKFWGYDAFRPLQREAIDCALQHRDSVVVLPTGGGKSLCFQVPALCESKVTLVVSPLISLMKDQVDALVRNGIEAASINSTMSSYEKQDVANRIRSGELKLLYLAPERLVQASTIEFLQKVGVASIAIDEAHCISSWGHDFRADYRQLSHLKEQFPGVSIHAFTATATPKVRLDIASQLKLHDAKILVGSFDRENLRYTVTRRLGLIDQIREIADRHPQQSGVIYCISRKEVESVTATLQHYGYKAAAYHAGLSDADRAKNQDDFIHSRVHIIIATVAFGMGIDKAAVRFVIHAAMPKSLEAYQQESGRAGRDGLPSECTLLYSGADYVVWSRMQESSLGNAKELLDSINAYSTRPACRHQMLVEYFGQKWEQDNCGNCDFCLEKPELYEDSMILAQKVISCVYRVGERFGASHVGRVLSGSRSQRIIDLGHDKLSTHGLLANMPNSEITDVVNQLIAADHLQKSGEYNVIGITPSGHQILKGQLTPTLYNSQSTTQSQSSSSNASGRKSSKMTPARTMANELFANGKSIEDVAAAIDRKPATVSTYLSEYIFDNQITDPSPWVASKRASEIVQAANKADSLERLAPIRDILGDQYSYEEIRPVVDCMRVRKGQT